MLRYGYFADFKGGPKLLFWGEGKDMERLTLFLQETARGEKAAPFAELNWTKAVGGASVVIDMSHGATGLRRGPGAQDFVWGLDLETVEVFAEKIGALARVGPAGHQYLDCGAGDAITVMVSRSEYPPHHAP